MRSWEPAPVVQNRKNVYQILWNLRNYTGLGAFPQENRKNFLEEMMMIDLAKRLWRNEEGQDIAEYAVMLAVILVIVIGTIRLIGGNANNVFSSVASGISQ